MKAGDLAELGLRNLREAALRNSLTTLGVAVGVASLVAMLSLGVGLQQLATRRLSHSGLFDTVVVMPKSNMRGMGRRSPDAPALSLDTRALDDNARAEIAHLPNVLEVFPQIRFMTEVRYAGNPYTTMVAGVPESAQQNGAFDDVKGSFFSNSNADEAILQIEFAKDLSSTPDNLIGKDIVIRYAERQALAPSPASSPASEDKAAHTPKSTGSSTAAGNGGAKANKSSDQNADETGAAGFSIVPREKTLKIVGIVETEPAAGFGGFGNGRVMIPLAVAETLRAAQANDLRDIVRGTNPKPTYMSLTVRVKGPSQVAAVEDAIKKIGFGTFSLLDATKNLSLFFAVFDSLLGIFGSLALAVATLGIINTLVMAILERRREIGVLKALGAADRDVRQLFFFEAGVMGLLGGIFGVGFGWFIGRAVTIGTNIYLKRQNLPPANVFSVPWWLVIAAIGFAVIVSLAAGLYPASRAARLNPVEALRYE
jgi:putative ABC transport system permease protein